MRARLLFALLALLGCGLGFLPIAGAQAGGVERFRAFLHVPATSAANVPKPASTDGSFKLLAPGADNTTVFAVRANGLNYDISSCSNVNAARTCTLARGVNNVNWPVSVRAVALSLSKTYVFLGGSLSIDGKSATAAGRIEANAAGSFNLYDLVTSKSFSLTGGYPEVSAIAVSPVDGTTFFGGSFDGVGGTATKIFNIVGYNAAAPTSFFTLPPVAATSGVNGPVRTLAIYAPTSGGGSAQLFLSGDFTATKDATVTASNQLLRYDISAKQFYDVRFNTNPLPPAFSSAFTSILAVENTASPLAPPLNFLLYLGGSFSSGASGFNGILKFVATSVSSATGEILGDAMVVGGGGLGEIPTGASTSVAATVTAIRPFPYVDELLNEQSPVVVVGAFTNARDGTLLNNVAVYWPSSDSFRPLFGRFASANGIPNYLEGVGVQGLQTPFPSSGSLLQGDISRVNDALLVGATDLWLAFDGDHVGNGLQAPGIAVFSIAGAAAADSLSGSTGSIIGNWIVVNALGDGIGFNDKVRAIFEDTAGVTGPVNDPPALLFGGAFSRAGLTVASAVVRYTPQNGFEPLTDASRSYNGLPLAIASSSVNTLSSVHAFAVFKSSLVVGGRFRIPGETNAKVCCIAVFDKVTSRLKGLGSGWGVFGSNALDSVNAFAVMGNRLYLGGYISNYANSTVGSAPAYNVLQYDGSTLLPLTSADGINLPQSSATIVYSLHAFRLPLPAPTADFIDVLAIGGLFSDANYANAVLFSFNDVKAATEGILVSTGGTMQKFFNGSAGNFPIQPLVGRVSAFFYSAKTNALFIGGSFTAFQCKYLIYYSFVDRNFRLLTGGFPTNDVYALTAFGPDAFVAGGSFASSFGGIPKNPNRLVIYNTTTSSYKALPWATAGIFGVGNGASDAVSAIAITSSQEIVFGGDFDKPVVFNNAGGYNTSEIFPSYSPSVTPTVTPSLSFSKTGSRTPSGSASPSPVSPSMTPSPSGSESPSASGSPSVAASPTSTRSIEASTTPSATATSSLSPSVHESGTPAITTTPTGSPTVSPSITSASTISPTGSPSRTGSASESASLSGSASLSPSSEATVTPSRSIEATTSATPSETASTTGSSSITPSLSATPSVSLSITPSPGTLSRSASVSISASETPSESPSPVSPSMTPSSSGTSSKSPSLTSSPSATSEITSSLTASVSLSPSASESVSASLSGSGSLSPSASASVSGSASVSESLSGSSSLSSSFSATSSASGTASSTGSLSRSSTASASQSSSESSTASASESASLTSSESETATLTGSETESSTVTPSSTVSPSSTSSESETPSVVETQTPSRSIAGTSSLSGSVSPSNAASPSASPSSSASPSGSTSVSPSTTPSPSIPASALQRLKEEMSEAVFGSPVEQLARSYPPYAMPGTFYSGPLTVAVDSRDGSLFVAERQNYRILALQQAFSSLNNATFEVVAGRSNAGGNKKGDPFGLAFRTDVVAAETDLPEVAFLALHTCAFFFTTPASGHVFTVSRAASTSTTPPLCSGRTSLYPGKLLTLSLLPVLGARLHIDDACSQGDSIVAVAVAANGTVFDLRPDGSTNRTWSPTLALGLASNASVVDSALSSSPAASCNNGTTGRADQQRLFLLTSTGLLIVLQPVLVAANGNTAGNISRIAWEPAALSPLACGARFSMPRPASMAFVPPSALLLVTEPAPAGLGSAELWAVLTGNWTAVSLGLPPAAAPAPAAGRRRLSRELAAAAAPAVAFNLPSSVTFDESSHVLVLADATGGGVETIGKSSSPLTPSAAPVPGASANPQPAPANNDSGALPAAAGVSIAAGLIAILVLLPLLVLLVIFACYFRRAFQRRMQAQRETTKRREAARRMRVFAKNPGSMGSSVAVVDALALVDGSSRQEIGESVTQQLLLSASTTSGEGGVVVAAAEQEQAFVAKLLRSASSSGVSPAGLSGAVTLGLSATTGDSPSNDVLSHSNLVEKAVAALSRELDGERSTNEQQQVDAAATRRFLQQLVAAAEKDPTIAEAASTALRSRYLKAALADLELPAAFALLPLQALSEPKSAAAADIATKARVAALVDAARLVEEEQEDGDAAAQALQVSVGGEDGEEAESLSLSRALRRVPPPPANKALWDSSRAAAPAALQGSGIEMMKVDLASRKRTSTAREVVTAQQQRASITNLSETTAKAKREVVRLSLGVRKTAIQVEGAQAGAEEDEEEEEEKPTLLLEEGGGDDDEGEQDVVSTKSRSSSTGRKAERLSTTSPMSGAGAIVSQVSVAAAQSRRSLQNSAASTPQPVLLKAEQSRRVVLEALACITLDLAAKKAAEIIIAAAPEDDQEEKGADAQDDKKSDKNKGESKEKEEEATVVTVHKLLAFAVASSSRTILAPKRGGGGNEGRRSAFAPLASTGNSSSSASMDSGIALNPLRPARNSNSNEVDEGFLTVEMLTAAVLSAPAVKQVVQKELKAVEQSNDKAAEKARREALQEARQRLLVLLTLCGRRRQPLTTAAVPAPAPALVSASAATPKLSSAAKVTPRLPAAASSSPPGFHPNTREEDGKVGAPAPATIELGSLKVRTPAAEGSPRHSPGKAGRATLKPRPSFGGSSPFFLDGVAAAAGAAGASNPNSASVSTSASPAFVVASASGGGWGVSPLSPFVLPPPATSNGITLNPLHHGTGMGAGAGTVKRVQLPAMEALENPMTSALAHARRPSVRVLMGPDAAEGVSGRMSFSLPSATFLRSRSRSGDSAAGTGEGDHHGSPGLFGLATPSQRHIRRPTGFPLAAANEAAGVSEEPSAASSGQRGGASLFTSMLAPQPVLRSATRKKKLAFSSVGTGLGGKEAEETDTNDGSETTAEDQKQAAPVSSAAQLAFFNKQPRLSLAYATGGSGNILGSSGRRGIAGGRLSGLSSGSLRMSVRKIPLSLALEDIDEEINETASHANSTTGVSGPNSHDFSNKRDV